MTSTIDEPVHARARVEGEDDVHMSGVVLALRRLLFGRVGGGGVGGSCEQDGEGECFAHAPFHAWLRETIYARIYPPLTCHGHAPVTATAAQRRPTRRS